MPALGSPDRGNAVTEIMQNSVSQAVTKPLTESVHNIISLSESENAPNPLRYSESRSQITVKMQNEAEICFSDISGGPPQVGSGNDFHHISVIALLGPGLPTGGTCDTCGTRSMLATLGQDQRGGQSDVSFIQSDVAFIQNGPSLKTSG